MHKPTLKRAASRFAEIAQKTGGMFVFASRDATLPNRASVQAEIAKHKFATHHCNKCTSSFAYPKAEGAQPFCVVCGDGDVDVQDDVNPNIAPDEELSYLTCAGCGTINTFHSALAGVGAHIHCSACGTDMLATAEAEDNTGTGESDEDLDSDIDFEDVDLDDGTEEAAEGEGDGEGDGTDTDLDDMELLDLEDDLVDNDSEGETATTTNEDTVGVKPDGKSLGDDTGADRGPGAPDSANTDGATPSNPGNEPPTQNPGAIEPKVSKAAQAKVAKADADEMPGNDYSGDEEDEDDVDTVSEAGFKDYSPDKQAKYLLNHPGSKYHKGAKKGKKKVKSEFGDEDEGTDESIDLDLVDLDTEGEDTLAAVSFFYGDKKVMLAAKDQIIATLSETDAGPYKDMLQTEQFRMSVAHTIETEGLKKAIATYKFKPSKVSVKISKVVATKVEATLAAQKVKIEASANSYADQFQHSLDIAAAGYAGNFWRNKHDPLKTALIAELTSLNIRRPEKIVDKIFAQYSVPQFREVLEIARGLAKKPVDALNALAETIDLVKYTPITAKKNQVKAADEEDQDLDQDADEDFDEDEDGDEDSGTEFATATPVQVTSSFSSSSSQYKTPELRRILGGSDSFFN